MPFGGVEVVVVVNAAFPVPLILARACAIKTVMETVKNIKR
jgi:hypothetical protein